jgi:hypothetical protein
MRSSQVIVAQSKIVFMSLEICRQKVIGMLLASWTQFVFLCPPTATSSIQKAEMSGNLNDRQVDVLGAPVASADPFTSYSPKHAAVVSITHCQTHRNQRHEGHEERHRNVRREKLMIVWHCTATDFTPIGNVSPHALVSTVTLADAI